MDAARNGKMPEVYVDASPLGDPWLTGIGRYTARLALALKRRSKVRFFSEGYEIAAPRALDWTHEQDLQKWARAIWRGRRMPLENGTREQIGVYPCLRPAERRFRSEISVLHDFTPLVVPHTHTANTRAMFQEYYARFLNSADWAISVSHATKHDASWLCDFPQERIVVSHSGPSLCVERHLDTQTTPRRRNVALVVATLEPRKNADFLLEWFRNSKAIDDGSELWWVGRVGWLSTKSRYRKYLNLKGRRIRFLGTVDDARLCRLYRTAAVSIYPTLYEGFGFPVLDSLRHGTPVLTGYHSALREFEHLDGVSYFDPCDAATLDDAWRAFDCARPSVSDLSALDDQYCWDRVADSVLECASAGKPVDSAKGLIAA